MDAPIGSNFADMSAGGAGKDTYKFGDTGSQDLIQGTFTPGDFATGGSETDRIDLSDLLDTSGATQATIDQFVKITAGTVQVDTDGAGSDSFETVATFQNALSAGSSVTVVFGHDPGETAQVTVA